MRNTVPFEGEGVELAGGVLAERGQCCRRSRPRSPCSVMRPPGLADGEDLAGAVVAVEVGAGEARDRRPAVDVAADDGAAARRAWPYSRMGRDGAGGRGALVGPGALQTRASRSSRRPSTTAAAKSISSTAFWPTSPIHRSPVAGRTSSATGCAGRRPRSRPGRRPGRRRGCRTGWCTAGRPKGAGSIRSILPSSVAEVLGPVLGVVAAAAVAQADPQLAVGPEDQVAAVVVGVGLVDRQHLAGAWPGRPGRRRRRTRPPGCRRRCRCS